MFLNVTKLLKGITSFLQLFFADSVFLRLCCEKGMHTSKNKRLCEILNEQFT